MLPYHKIEGTNRDDCKCTSLNLKLILNLPTLPSIEKLRFLEMNEKFGMKKLPNHKIVGAIFFWIIYSEEIWNRFFVTFRLLSVRVSLISPKRKMACRDIA